jgi:hypothetical protein
MTVTSIWAGSGVSISLGPVGTRGRLTEKTKSEQNNSSVDPASQRELLSGEVGDIAFECEPLWDAKIL